MRTNQISRITSDFKMNAIKKQKDSWERGQVWNFERDRGEVTLSSGMMIWTWRRSLGRLPKFYGKNFQFFILNFVKKYLWTLCLIIHCFILLLLFSTGKRKHWKPLWKVSFVYAENSCNFFFICFSFLFTIRAEKLLFSRGCVTAFKIWEIYFLEEMFKCCLVLFICLWVWVS